MSTTEWDIAKPVGTCARCARVLQPGEDHFSLLIDRTTEFARNDVCCDCWTRGGAGECFGFWKTQVPRKDAKRRRFVDDDVILNFFDRCEGSDDPLRLSFRFVLSLVLMRKRLVKYENTEMEGGAEYWTMRVNGRDEPVKVLNPKLDEEQIRQVSEELGKILNSEV